MSPRDERTIERLIRFPDSLSPQEREDAEHLLRTDPAAREVAAFFRTFYEELDAIPPAEAPPDAPSDDEPR